MYVVAGMKVNLLPELMYSRSSAMQVATCVVLPPRHPSWQVSRWTPTLLLAWLVARCTPIILPGILSEVLPYFQSYVWHVVKNLPGIIQISSVICYQLYSTSQVWNVARYTPTNLSGMLPDVPLLFCLACCQKHSEFPAWHIARCRSTLLTVTLPNVFGLTWQIVWCALNLLPGMLQDV